MRALLSKLKADWARHSASSSYRSMVALANYRFGVWVRDKPFPVRFIGGKIYGAGLLASEVISGIFMDRDTDVGEELHFVHAGGINIHPQAKIGNRVGMMHGVTLGADIDGEAPTVHDDVFIGANATILGPVVVGEGARVAANSLVLSDVPAGMLAIGVPAKNIPQFRVGQSRSSGPTTAKSGGLS